MTYYLPSETLLGQTAIVPGTVLHYADPGLPDEPCVVIMVLTARESIVFSTLGRADGAARRISVNLEAALPRLHTLSDCGMVPVLPA